MNILATQYTLQYKSLDIYVAGCKALPHCQNCHNPETWEFNQGELYDKKYFNKIKNKINDFDDLINNIMIFGGEPLDQDYSEIMKMLKNLNTLHKKVWIFTRYDLKDIPNSIKNLCDYIKCGRYIPKYKCKDNIYYGINLATSNQIIYKKGTDY